MSMVEAGSKANRWGVVALALLPIVLALLFHHPEWLRGRRANLGPDGHFYVYQMGSVAESHGAWWKLAEDEAIIFKAIHNLYLNRNFLLIGSL